MTIIQDKIKTLTLGDIIDNECVSICLFRNVSNSKELLNFLLDNSNNGRIVSNDKKQSFLLMNARMIYSVEHILISVSTCLLKRKLGCKRRTKSFETEILYNMSSSTNISYSLRTYGINETTKDIICLFINIENQKKIEDFLSLIKGEIDYIENLYQVHDINEIKKMINFSKTSQHNISIVEILRGLISIKDI